jgi:hypothetical protein
MILLILLVVFILLTLLLPVFAILVIAAAAGLVYVGRLADNVSASERILDNQKQLESLPTIPPRPNFTLHLSDEAATPPPTSTGTGQDSREAANFRTAAIEMNTRLAVKAPEEEIVPFNLSNAYARVGNAIHPYISFPTRLSAFVQFPSYIDLSQPENIFPAMAYPDFEDPMYKGLSDISSELLLPNLKLIPPNTISDIHRSLHGGTKPRNGRGIIVAGISHGSTRQLFSSILGCEGDHSSGRGEDRSRVNGRA